MYSYETMSIILQNNGLISASESGDAVMVASLLNSGADIHTVDMVYSYKTLHTHKKSVYGYKFCMIVLTI